jgi:hypothetical protein
MGVYLMDPLLDHADQAGLAIIGDDTPALARWSSPSSA